MKIEPGIFFGLPEAEHHAIDAVGSSALRNMLIDPLTCWVRNVDPKRKPPEDTPATLRGRAYHTLLLEGREAFDSRFARALVQSEHPDAAWTAEALRDLCQDAGIKTGRTKREMAEALSTFLPSHALGPMIEQEHERASEGKTILPAEDFDALARAAEIMEANGIRSAFSGGAAEVTIVWNDEKTGLLCKARIDYLKPAAALDLKTFANITGKPLDVAVAQTFIFQRHHVQAYHYLAGIEHAKKKLFDLGVGSTWLSQFADKPHDFFMVYRQTGDVPNVSVRRFAQRVGGDPTAYYRTAAFERDLALAEYKRCMETFGPDKPWTDGRSIDDFTDEQFPSYMIDQ